MKAAESVSRKELEDAFAIGGIWAGTTGREKDIQAGFEELFNMAYNARPIMCRWGLWKGSRHEVQDEVARLVKKFKANEIFLWHHFRQWRRVFPAGLHSRLIRRWTERPAGHGTW